MKSIRRPSLLQSGEGMVVSFYYKYFFYLFSLRINGERNGISSKSATTPT